MNAVVDREPRQRFMPLPSRGGKMAFLDIGPQDRPVDVVFSHANGFNGRTYRTILEPLTHLRILALDLRGHGASTLPATADGWPGWHGFRDDLLAFLAAEVEGPVVLAGHSMGGTTSLLAAAAEPARVKALGLFDPVVFDPSLQARDPEDSGLVAGAMRRRADFPSRAAVVEAYTGRGAFRSWTKAQLADYVEAGFRETPTGVTLTCPPTWEASNFRLHNYDPFAAFRDSHCPIRVLKAETASTARFDGHDGELAANPRISIEMLPGTTHFLPMERPDRVRETLAVLSAL